MVTAGTEAALGAGWSHRSRSLGGGVPRTNAANAMRKGVDQRNVQRVKIERVRRRSRRRRRVKNVSRFPDLGDRRVGIRSVVCVVIVIAFRITV